MIKNKRRAIPNFFIALVLVAGINWVCGRFVYMNDLEFKLNKGTCVKWYNEKDPITK